MGVDAVGLYRVGRSLKRANIPWVPVLLQRLNLFLHGTYLPLEAELGEGTELGYGGMGVVVHPQARVGKGCLLSQQVTLGGRSGMAGLPRIGDYVRIGAGARVLGDVEVGDFAVIGANAVVVKSVPRGGVVAGVPARLLRIDPTPEATWAREMGRTLPRFNPGNSPDRSWG